MDAMSCSADTALANTKYRVRAVSLTRDIIIDDSLHDRMHASPPASPARQSSLYCLAVCPEDSRDDSLHEIVIHASDAADAAADSADIFADAVDCLPDAGVQQAFADATAASALKLAGADAAQPPVVLVSPAVSAASDASAASTAYLTDSDDAVRSAAGLRIAAAALDIRLSTIEIHVAELQQNLIVLQQHTRISQKKRLSEGAELQRLDKVALDQKYLRDEIDRALRRFHQSEFKFNSDVADMGVELKKLRDNFLCLFEMTHDADAERKPGAKQIVKKQGVKEMFIATGAESPAKTRSTTGTPEAGESTRKSPYFVGARDSALENLGGDSPTKQAAAQKKRVSILDMFTRTG